MILQTGGSELGATTTRSKASWIALSIASWVGMIPSCCPSAPIRRTALAWILSLTLTSSVFLTITLPPLFAILADPLNQLHRFHEGQIFSASQPRRDALHLRLPVADNQHVRDFLELGLSDLQAQLFIAEIP